MNRDKRVILHITFDGIFFDQVYPKFEEMDGYENRYLLHNIGHNGSFRFIKNSQKVICADSIKKWAEIIGDPSVDIIYLHGLWPSYFKAFDYIRSDVIVMWWCYGMEIYESSLRWPPLLPLKIYKPITHRFLLKKKMGMKLLAKELSRIAPRLFIFSVKATNLLKGRRIDELEYVLSRIDYAFTPLDIEFEELKKKHSIIKAKPFRLYFFVDKDTVQKHNSAGNILLEHSANITNNHLDIIAAIKKKGIQLKGRDIYVPLSYGESVIASRVQKEARFEDAIVHCLMEPVPFDEYSNIISSCTHAFFGMIRQSGLGNIFLCLRKGIKVFFFKDSILYKHFKQQGFYVFSIEDELNDLNLIEPLSPEQAEYNAERFYSLYVSPSTYQQQFDKILRERLINQ